MKRIKVVMDIYVFASNFPLFPVLCQLLLSQSWSVIKPMDSTSCIRTKLNEKPLSFRRNESRMNLLCIKSRTFMTEVRPPFPRGIQVPTRLSSVPPWCVIYDRLWFLPVPGVHFRSPVELELLPMSHCLVETLTYSLIFPPNSLDPL